MTELFGSDAYSPREVAQRIQQVGVVKARLHWLPLTLLSLLAGAFIGMGAMGFVLVKSDATLGYATSQWLGGLVFSVGLFMVVVAGAELFTGNNLLVMAWADRRIAAWEVIRNWVLVCTGNLCGAVGLALLVGWSGQASMNGGAVGETVLKIALAKQALPWFEALVRGLLCNMLVCLAVWMSMAGRSVMDKWVAVALPVMLFVAAGFEHSIANMYLMPLAWVLQTSGQVDVAWPAITWAGMLGNWVPVIVGNLLGGSLLVGLVYHLIYRRSV